MKNILVGSLLISSALSLNAYAEDNNSGIKPNPAAPAQSQDSSQPAPASAASNPAPAPAQAAPTIDCQYKIPASTKTVDLAIVSQWVEKAAVQSFDFDKAHLDQQLKDLQACYTNEGWKSFSEALNQSGNLEAIKAKNLTVSVLASSKPVVESTKPNQWKVTLPLEVVYQNDKNKLTQDLDVMLVVGRKPSGDLGIMQLVATNKQEVKTPTATPEAPTPAPDQPTNQQ